MSSMLFELVRKNYINGYGMPLQFYNDTQLEQLVKTGVITDAEYHSLITEKKEQG